MFTRVENLRVGDIVKIGRQQFEVTAAPEAFDDGSSRNRYRYLVGVRMEDGTGHTLNLRRGTSVDTKGTS